MRDDRSNSVTFTSPDREYTLAIEIDEPVQGYLVRMWTLDDGRDDRIGQALVDNEETVLKVAASMAAGARDLEAVSQKPAVDPKTVHEQDVRERTRGGPDTPDEWDDDQEWEETLQEAFDEAGIPRSKGTLTTKTIDERDYYYLQWREGEKVKSQYVAPVNPTD